MTDKPLKYVIEHPTYLKQYVFDFIFFISGIKGEKCNFDSNQDIDVYYGNNPSFTDNISIIIRETNREVISPEIVDGKLKPEQVDKILDFDIIYAISELLTDHVNSNLSDEAYDEHGRLLFSHSFQSRSHLNDIPIVNLYVNFLLELIEHKCHLVRVPLWPKGKTCAIGLSHDVDNPDKYSTIRAPLFIKSKPIRENISNNVWKIRAGVQYLIDKERNNFWLFNNIMALEETYGFKSTFFVASVNAYSKYGSGLDVRYNIDNKKFRTVFYEILESKFELGLHASYFAYKSGERFEYEKQKLEEIVKVKITGLRHHYWHMGRDQQRALRLHESAGFKYDSSIAFEEHMGFRYNTALPYYPWNEEANRGLNVMQLPVFCMDGDLSYQPLEVDIVVGKLKKFVLLIKQFGGVGIIDWHVHTSYPLNTEFTNWGKCYVKLIEYLSSDNTIWVNSLGNINDWLSTRSNNK